MTVAVIITLMASFIWAITNHIDKYLLCKIDDSTSSIKTLLVFSTLIAGIILSPIWLAINKFQVQISLIALGVVVIAGILYVASTYLYFKALEKNDASIIVVMYQLLPVFSYIFSLIFFNEVLGLKEIIGGLIIILSAITISLDFSETSDKNKAVALILTIFSSILYSLFYICFDFATRNSSYNSVAFWYQVVLIFIGIFFICIKAYRQDFINMIRNNGKKFVSLNITNEALNLIANLMVNFANLTIPLAIANTLNGFQGAFVFIIGAVGVLLYPKIFSEELSRKIIIQKLVCIMLGIVGLFIMFY